MHKKQGSSLLMVMVFIMLGAALAGSALTTTATHTRITGRQIRMERASFIAESGIELAAQVVSDTGGYLSASNGLTATCGNGMYTYSISKIGTQSYQLDSVGTFQDISRVVSINRIYLPTYAKFSMWMKVNGNIWFFPGEEFFGHVHSDDILQFSSDPFFGGTVFHDEVSSRMNTYGGTTNWVTFYKGFEMNSDHGSMANVNFNQLLTLANRADLNGLVLEGNTDITIVNNTMQVTNDRMGWTNHTVQIHDDQLVYIKDSNTGSSTTKAGKVFLHGGTLDGRMTLVTDDDIRIDDHIRYANSPADDNLEPEYRDFPGVSMDALGLISKDDVWIETDAPANLDLYAAIMAVGQKENNSGSFGLLNYWAVPAKDDLNLFGGIVQDVRGVVNLHNSGSLINGYRKNYKFDQRFKYSPPPYYPTLNSRWQLEGWSDGPA